MFIQLYDYFGVYSAVYLNCIIICYYSVHPSYITWDGLNNRNTSLYNVTQSPLVFNKIEHYLFHEVRIYCRIECISSSRVVPIKLATE